MSRFNQLKSAAFYIVAGQGAGQLLAIIRNLVVARLISPFDFGIAAAIAATLSILEMASDVSLEKLIIQATDGDDPVLQDVCHTLILIRGVLLSVLLFLAAPLVAGFFSVPEAVATFQCLAVAPLVRGFSHLDVKRIQRELNFRADTDTVVIAQACGVLAAIGGAIWFGDYRSMLAAILVYSTVLTVGTHIRASRVYRLAWDRAIVTRSLTFAWPLILNGIVIALAGQVDRFLVGGMIGVEPLAVFAVALLLVTSPMLVATKLVGALALPILSKLQHDESAFAAEYRRIGAAIFLSAFPIFVPLAFLGTDFAAVLFGSAYTLPHALVPWLSLGMALRYIRGWPVVASLARGDSKNILVVNVVRISGVAAGYVAIENGWGLVGMVMGLVLGETLAYFAGVVRQNLKSNMPVHTGTGLLVILFFFCFCPVLIVPQIAGLGVAVSVAAAAVWTLLSVISLFLVSRASWAITHILIDRVVRRS
jgi:O-antigen/teichoic acid export membrane protein